MSGAWGYPLGLAIALLSSFGVWWAIRHLRSGSKGTGIDRGRIVSVVRKDPLWIALMIYLLLIQPTILARDAPRRSLAAWIGLSAAPYLTLVGAILVLTALLPRVARHWGVASPMAALRDSKAPGALRAWVYLGVGLVVVLTVSVAWVTFGAIT